MQCENSAGLVTKGTTGFLRLASCRDERAASGCLIKSCSLNQTCWVPTESLTRVCSLQTSECESNEELLTFLDMELSAHPTAELHCLIITCEFSWRKPNEAQRQWSESCVLAVYSSALTLKATHFKPLKYFFVSLFACRSFSNTASLLNVNAYNWYVL